MTTRLLLTTRLANACRARRLDADSPELESFAEAFLAETLVEGEAVYDRSLEGQKAFARLLRDLRRRLRLEGPL
jgi:hypothetical protein